jgi:hypothetical protein
VRALAHGQPQPAREVRVEDVEAPGAELEVDAWRVDEHDVADLDLAGQARIGDARRAVDLEPHEPSRRSPTARHRAPAEPSASGARLARRVDDRERDVDHPLEVLDAIRSSGVWMSVIPLARLTHGSPRSLKTFASAAPPESTSRGSNPARRRRSREPDGERRRRNR